MSDGNEYQVSLKIGRDVPDVNDVQSIISRQLLCEMAARIEDDVWQWRERDVSVKCGVCGRVAAGMQQIVNHNYLITGVRGSGKTTFLNYVIATLTRELDPFEKTSDSRAANNLKRYTAKNYIDNERRNVTCSLLCRFDPSSHDVRHGYFLLSVVAAIQSKLEEVYSSHYNDGVCFKAKWQRCRAYLNCLDIGIARLSKGRPALSDMSEEQVKNLRTENAELEEQIRSNFAQAVEALCNLCCVDAFIISIDDADTRSAQCADVIEDLRLYVSHPRLIVLLAGDLDLYMERIREIHFKEYDSDYHKVDEKGKEARMNYVVSHANQYFIKQFPVENHYELRDLNYLALKRDPIVCMLIANGDDPDIGYKGDLAQAVNKIFSIILNRSDRDIEAYVALFMGLPMRSIIQVLKGWSLMEVWKMLKDVNKVSPTAKKSSSNREAQASMQRQLRNAVKYSLSRILLNEVRYGDYSFGKMDLDDPPTFFSLLLRHCQNMNDTEHGYFLSGDIGDTLEERYMSLLLAISSGNMLQGFSGFLSYLLYGPASVSLYAKASEQISSQKKEETDLLRVEFNHYIHVRSWNSPTRWARNANMIWCHDPEFGGLHTGILRLRHSGMIETLNKHIMTNAFLDNNYVTSYKALAMLAAMSMSVDRDNSYFISLFHFLAFILKCALVCEHAAAKARRSAKNIENTIRKEILQLLEDLYPIKSSRNPSWLIKEGQTQCFNIERIRLAEKSDGENSSPSKREIESMEALKCLQGGKVDVENMAQKIYQWYNDYICKDPGENNLSVHSMANLWADIYYGIRRICHNINFPATSGEDLNTSLGKHYKHIEAFHKTLNFFFNHVCGPKPLEESDRDNQRDYYLGCLKAFPLTSYFIEACELFSESSIQLHKKSEDFQLQSCAVGQGKKEPRLEQGK